MSVAGALQFIRRVREDQALRNRIQALESTTEEALVQVGAAAGWDFTAEELQVAFKHDWRMRWLHYSARHPYQQILQLPPRAGSPLPGS